VSDCLDSYGDLTAPSSSGLTEVGFGTGALNAALALSYADRLAFGGVAIEGAAFGSVVNDIVSPIGIQLYALISLLYYTDLVYVFGCCYLDIVLG
jgi:hypothetical protein